jgi:hypothetical protein
VLDEEGALVVEDDQRRFGFDEVGAVAEQGSADVETGPASIDGPSVAAARHPDPFRGGHERRTRGRSRWGDDRGRVPCLLRGDPSGQAVVRPLRVVDDVERINLALQYDCC